MEMDLKNIKWGEFEIGKLFKIENCKCSNVSLLQKGSMPYVGATNRNNGILKFVKPIERFITKGNCIAFICDGEGSVGYSIYKNEDFIGSTTVKVGYNKHLNKYNASFITTLADTVRSKYNFGFKRNQTHLKKEKVLLPINLKSEPDYALMEHFMRQKEQEQIDKFNNYITKRIEKVKYFKEVEPLDQKKWGEFLLNEVFQKIQRGKRLKKDNHKKGLTPYVSSSAINNGIDGFVSNKERVRIFAKCLTLANSGSVGATFFQPFSFVASDHITKLENKNLNEYVYLFISSITKRLSDKYSFNREINDARIQREKIVLPIDQNGRPDFDYMENYTKKIEYEKLLRYIRKKDTALSSIMCK